MRTLLNSAKGRATIAFAIAGMILVAWIFWSKSNTVGAVAVRNLQGLFDGEYESVGRLALKEEGRDGNPAKQLQIVWEHFVKPTLASGTPQGDISLESGGDRVNALAVQHYQLPNGAQVGVAIQLSQTEEGPRGSLLQPLLYQAWYNRYAAKPDYKKVPGDISTAVRLGVAEDKERLRGFGINGVFVDRANRYMTWDELAAFLDEKAR